MWECHKSAGSKPRRDWCVVVTIGISREPKSKQSQLGLGLLYCKWECHRSDEGNPSWDWSVAVPTGISRVPTRSNPSWDWVCDIVRGNVTEVTRAIPAGIGLWLYPPA